MMMPQKLGFLNDFNNFLGHLLMLTLQVNKLLCEYAVEQNEIHVKMILT